MGTSASYCRDSGEHAIFNTSIHYTIPRAAVQVQPSKIRPCQRADYLIKSMRSHFTALTPLKPYEVFTIMF
ncbi:MAG: hypothetical protein LBR76_03660, partial [Oscillospiraceae bacterium]|nr:hypothetical protein [Oscillospiraceae bacterium]